MNISNPFNLKGNATIFILSLLLIDIAFHSQATARESLSSLREDITELQNQDRQTTSQLFINEVFIGDNGETLVINGVNFDNGDLPMAEFGGQELVIASADALQIIADLPPSFINGSYTLTVSTGSQRSQFDSFEVALGIVGLEGPSGVQGATGPQGTEGSTGRRGIQGPRGFPGPQGFQGPIGPQGNPPRVSGVVSGFAHARAMGIALIQQIVWLAKQPWLDYVGMPALRSFNGQCIRVATPVLIGRGCVK